MRQGRAPLTWSLVAALVVAGCGGDSGAPSVRPATANPGLPSAPAGASTAGTPGQATEAELLAFAESLAPPNGVERSRTITDGAMIVRWISADPLEALDAHYQRVTDEGGFAVVRTSAGPLLTFIFTSTDAIAAAGSIQVTVAPGEGHLVSVTVAPAT